MVTIFLDLPLTSTLTLPRTSKKESPFPCFPFSLMRSKASTSRLLCSASKGITAARKISSHVLHYFCPCVVLLRKASLFPCFSFILKLELRKPVRNLRSSNKLNLVVPTCSGTFQDRAANLFNSLPKEIRNCTATTTTTTFI